jgi:ribonuclease E
MSKQIVIAEQHRIAAVFAEDQIEELIVAKGTHQIGDIYLGLVENVLPGIDAAFVNIGDSERNGFIHVSDLGPVRLKKSAGAITELLAPQQKVLVQVMKEPTGTKGPRLTGNISLPGRYLVLIPQGRGVNLSRRILSEHERSRLRALAVLIKPAGMGLLVRTEAEGVAEEQIIEDLELLHRQWEQTQQQAESIPAPALLNRDDDFIQRVLRDVYSEDVNRIVVDSHTGYKRVKQHLGSWGGSRGVQGVLIEQHTESISVLEYFRVNAAIREALKPRVDLPSGGYVVIEPTEALTVVDVNSGSFTRSATARETVLWTNCEAATEIARQLRLRNLAGVIVVDFIDMESRRDQLQVLEHFTRALRPDKSRPQIAQLSELGLVELTRKRQGQNIYELFSQACPTCGGLGHIANLPGEEDVVPLVRSDRPAAPPASRFNPALLQTSFRGPQTFDGTPVEPERVQPVDFSLPATAPAPAPAGIEPNSRRRRRGGEIPRREMTPALVGESEALSGESPEPRSHLRRGGRDYEAPIRTERTLVVPEVIAVEMTPEEQEVYAWMGISPILLAKQDVQDPQQTLVSVILPGEDPGPAIEAVTTAALATHRRRRRVDRRSDSGEGFAPPTRAPRLVAVDEAESQDLLFEAEESLATGDLDSETDQFDPDFGAISAPSLEPSAAPDLPHEDESDHSAEPAETIDLRRRRRRRSSAEHDS